MYNSQYHIDRTYFEPLIFGNIRLAQVGKLYGTERTAVEAHIHTDLFEITVVTDGAGVITTNDISTPVEKGDIYLSMPCDVHKIDSDTDRPVKFSYLAFSVNDGDWKTTFEQLMQEHYNEHDRVFQDERIRPLINNILAELTEQKTHSRQVITALLYQLLAYIDRGFRDKTPATYHKDVNDADILCLRMMTYIDTHIYSLKTLDDLAEAMGYSYGYLSALFRKTTSFTLSSYYSRKRMEAARLLILENKLTATEIAKTLNYSSVYAFSKAFSKKFGVPPSRYPKE